MVFAGCALFFALHSDPVIGVPPVSWKLSPFYKKCIMLDGLPIVSSEKVPDKALFEANRLAKIMLAKCPDATKAMVKNRVRVAIMAETEQTLDIPEHSDLQKAFPETDWNKRARGLGATLERPAISAAEENLLRYKTDRYRGESIFIHEFSHAMMDMGLAYSRKGFSASVTRCFQNAKKMKLWEKTYAETNEHEYWAECVQSYFNSNISLAKPNGIHNDIATPEKLKAYDPEIYAVIESVYGKVSYSWQDDNVLVPAGR